MMTKIGDERGKDKENTFWILESILESSEDAIITESLNGIITGWNRGAERIYGYSADEILGMPISILEPLILVGEMKELTELIKQEDRIHNYETLQLSKDQKAISVSLTLSSISDSSEKLISILIIARDITETKKTEEKLLKSEEEYRKSAERYRIATEQTGYVIYEYDLKSDTCSWAGAIEEVTGYNFEEFQRLGKKVWTENIHSVNPNYIDREINDPRITGDRFTEELMFRRKDGTCIYIEHNGICLKNNEGYLYRSVGVIKDITKQKETEAILAKMELARKQEIHHRIKNNLQVISSLLDLQAEKFLNKEFIDNSEVLAAFRESQNRVISMALIHEELYRGCGFDKLNFSSYIKKLAENLIQIYQLGTNVSLKFDLEQDTYFDMDIAIPIGIIVNELVSNSLKYAFEGRKTGEIKIKLSGGGQDTEYINSFENSKNGNFRHDSFILAISDNGVGISKDLDIESLNSLGLQLVTSLVEQLDGTLELKMDNGTEFIIRFTITEK